jgi:hypothetical protein
LRWTPRNLPSALTNSLKQRARALRVERPWRDDVSADHRTVWVDHDGIGGRMAEAVKTEQRRRLNPGS